MPPILVTALVVDAAAKTVTVSEAQSAVPTLPINRITTPAIVLIIHSLKHLSCIAFTSMFV
jgi:hypothetical protein